MAAVWPSGSSRTRPAFVAALLDRALQARDRLLSSEAFRSKAATNPLTRRVARRRARDLFDLCAGFVYSQTLLASVRLRLFDHLASRPLTLAELSAALDLSSDATARLMQACHALKLVEKRSNDRYGLGPLGSALVDNPALVAMIEHHRHLYDDLGDPVSLLRAAGGDTRLAQYWPYADAEQPAALTDAQIAEYSRLMSLSQPLVAEEVLDGYAVARHRCLMDVGGGEGAFIARAAQRTPHLRFVLFDLPAVAARARGRLAERGVANRVDVHEGDFFRDPLPKGADIISLVRILLDHDDARVLRLLKACRVALPPDGTLLVAEPLAAPQRDRIGAAYFGMYLLAMGRGRARSEAELRRLLRAAGFADADVRIGQHALGTGILVAQVSR